MRISKNKDCQIIFMNNKKKKKCNLSIENSGMKLTRVFLINLQDIFNKIQYTLIVTLA